MFTAFVLIPSILYLIGLVIISLVDKNDADRDLDFFFFSFIMGAALLLVFILYISLLPLLGYLNNH